MLSHTLLALASAVPAFCSVAAAQPAADFFAGKTVKIVIGTTVGGEYALYAQLIARHIGKFVPGNPTVIVQTMPGGGGMLALNHLANAAAQDGTVLSLPHVNVVQDGLLNSQVRFDPRKFQWIGRIASLRQVGIASSKSQARSLADAKTRELVAGGSGVNNPTALNARILNTLAGTKFKIVTGYKGTSEVAIAWERGEVDVLTVSWDIIVDRYGDQLKAGRISPLFVYAMKRPPELANVPSMLEFGRDETEQAFLQIYSIGTEIGRSLVAPPGVPKERIAILRQAFAKMLSDPEFIQAVAQGGIRFDPLDGESLASSVAKVTDLPATTVVRARAFYQRLLDEVK
jgi:tripartite-type tricarboxylate transporter receptor subunit TctC